MPAIKPGKLTAVSTFSGRSGGEILPKGHTRVMPRGNKCYRPQDHHGQRKNNKMSYGLIRRQTTFYTKL